MRTVFILVTLTMAALARDSSAVAGAQAACGPTDVSFDVQEDRSDHSRVRPEAGKALVYVIQDDGVGGCTTQFWGCPMTKVALDGAWVGANHHNSYFPFAAEPGERHLCVILQWRFAIDSRLVGLGHFTAEAGKVYYFRTRIFGGNSQAFLDLEPIDSDQGRFFVAAYPLSVSHHKK